jgi:hypothetical protein
MYPSVPKSPAVMFVRFLTVFCGLGFWASLASEPQANRRHDGTVDQYPKSSDGFICRSFDASQAQALAPADAARPLFVYESRFPQPDRQTVHSSKVRVYASKFTPYPVLSEEVGQGRGCSCPSSLICGPRHDGLRGMYV